MDNGTEREFKFNETLGHISTIEELIDRVYNVFKMICPDIIFLAKKNIVITEDIFQFILDDIFVGHEYIIQKISRILNSAFFINLLHFHIINAVKEFPYFRNN